MRRTLLVAIIAAVLMVATVYAFNIPVRDGLAQVVDPLGTRLNRLAQNVKSETAGIVNPDKDDVDELRAEITRLRLRTVELGSLRAQNRQLRDELAFVRDNDFEVISADIINYHPDVTRDMIRINVGSRDGITANMPVMARSAIVGVVVQVSPATAEVLLATDINFRALVSVDGVDGVAKGQVGGGLVAEQLPRDRGVKAGALVSTSGRDGVYPPGLLIGTVRSVSQSPDEVFDTAQITPELSYRNLKVVTVIINQ